MDDVKLTELRQNLPSYLKQVEKGRELRITSRGKPVARLEPVQTIGLAPAIAALMRAGQVHWDGRPTTFSATVQVAPGESIAEQIVAERE